jgi:hypothetical protein
MNNTLLSELIGIIPASIAKINSIFNYTVSKALLGMTFLATCLGPGIQVIHYVLAAALLDLMWATVANVKTKRFILSICISKTAFKLAMYLSAIFMVAMVERNMIGSSDNITRVVGSLFCAADLWSVLGHISRVNPDLRIIKAIRKYLSAEVERKTGINIELKEKRNESRKSIKTERKRILSRRSSKQ